MYAIASFFLGSLFLTFIGPDAVDLVKVPFGTDLAIGDEYGAGRVVLVDGVKLLEVPLWRSYLAGCILLGVAPCTAMVLVWGFLAKGNDGHTLVMVALNSLTMLVLYGVLGGCRCRGRRCCCRSASTSRCRSRPVTSRASG
jgi:ACR3 family arsenite transporter